MAVVGIIPAFSQWLKILVSIVALLNSENSFAWTPPSTNKESIPISVAPAISVRKESPIASTFLGSGLPN
jgi:hypothetical protein